MMKLQYFGKTCISFNNDQDQVLVNPAPLSSWSDEAIKQVKATVIVLTYYTESMLKTAVQIAKNNNAKIYTSYPICVKFEEAGVNKENVNHVHIGQTVYVNEQLNITFFPCISNSNIAGALAMSLVINLDGTKVYHDGNSAYYSDMKFLADYHIDYACICISENESKNHFFAKRLISEMQPRFYIPIGYNEQEKTSLINFKDVLEAENIRSLQILLDPNYAVVIKE